MRAACVQMPAPAQEPPVYVCTDVDAPASHRLTWLPVSATKVPVAHRGHAPDLPGASEKRPTSHTVQFTSLALSSVNPGMQAWQMLAPSLRRVSRPAGQTVQVLMDRMEGRKVRRGLHLERGEDEAARVSKGVGIMAAGAGVESHGNMRTSKLKPWQRMLPRILCAVAASL